MDFVCKTSHYTLTFMVYQLHAPFWYNDGTYVRIRKYEFDCKYE